MSWTLNLFYTDGNPERQMLVNRVVLSGLLGGAGYFLAFDIRIVAAFFAYATVNAVLCLMQRHTVWKQEKRWLTAILFDAILGFAVMQMAPEQMSIFYPVLLLMILSNGFRFGVNWLLAASLFSTLSFGVVVISTAYWQQNLTLGFGLTVALLAIPAYCSTLIRNISDAKEQADLASQAKSYFLASVSHELRTPLNAIIGYGNHLRQTNMPSSQKDMVEASVLAGEHLLHLIEQLIDVAKAGTGKTEVKQTMFRAIDLLTEIRDVMIGRVEEKGLSLHLQAEPMSDNAVEGPVSVIRNILFNLVGNATKFTEAGSITISCGMTDRNNKSALWFVVSDTGIGICETAKERIFQPFQQADETVMNRFGGTGLGLSICKQLTKQVDGDITVESQIGQGSKFRIEIPVQILESSGNFDDFHIGAQINILAVGNIDAELLANTQIQESFNVRHIEYATRTEFLAAVADLTLQKFQVALIPECLADDFAADDALWAILAEADIPPVLVTEHSAIGLREIIHRPDYVSTLPVTADFAEIRSAIKIASALTKKTREFADKGETIAPNYTPRRVLVADDNRTNRNVLAAILESAGHYVSMATDGDEALAELEKGETDILLLDVNMPRLSGIDACRMWRKREGGISHLPIIGVTADATSETESKCLDAGMDLRITKPVDAQMLLSSIEKYCAEVTVVPNQQAIEQTQSHKVIPISRDAPAQTDAIDRTQIQYLRSIGDQAFVDTMIEGFLEDIGQTLEPLQNAVKNGDVSEFRFCAHAFKSSGNNMGARALSHLCGQLEKISEADFYEYKQDYLEQIKHELNRAVAARALSHRCGQLEKISEADFYEYKQDYLEQIEHELNRAVAALNADIYTGDVPTMAKAV